jgi:hypothetical protein
MGELQQIYIFRHQSAKVALATSSSLYGHSLEWSGLVMSPIQCKSAKRCDYVPISAGRSFPSSVLETKAIADSPGGDIKPYKGQNIVKEEGELQSVSHGTISIDGRRSKIVNIRRGSAYLTTTG